MLTRQIAEFANLSLPPHPYCPFTEEHGSCKLWRMGDANTTKAVSAAERKARVGRMVASGKLSKKSASLVAFREPGKRESQIAESLVAKGRRALAANRPS